MYLQALQKTLHHLRSHSSAASTQGHSPYPIICPEASIERTPSGIRRIFPPRLFFDPICQLVHKAFGVSLVSGQGVRLPETYPIAVTVHLKSEFLISIAHKAPVDSIFKVYWLIRLLHIPRQLEQKSVLSQFTSRFHRQGAILRPQCPAQRGASFQLVALRCHGLAEAPPLDLSWTSHIDSTPLRQFSANPSFWRFIHAITLSSICRAKRRFSGTSNARGCIC